MAGRVLWVWMGVWMGAVARKRRALGVLPLGAMLPAKRPT